MRTLSAFFLFAFLVCCAGCSSTRGGRRYIPAEYKTEVRGIPVPGEYSGGSDTPATCKQVSDIGSCTQGTMVGITYPVTWVETLSHDVAITRLREAGFNRVCCDGKDDHHNHSQSAIVQWQHCEAPGTIDVEDVVYLCFDAKNHSHP